ncbi:methyl-accepting chemotaxis protein [Halobacteriovorax sp. GB3]|uniref:methyl-accepting chemotaxis protein n=1 Tax=Halobacteriovorax sp. GB3 TaxID=2719615 RepID=UPI00235DE735|nr:methyl-accepting chemotaxis protein [Halobacteriovorax sp. GB3]MDD0852223.1 methyl-accepting chemotaxis protein [Halobacteriovorax sp. GB3]
MGLQSKVLTVLVIIFISLTSGIIYLNHQGEKAFVESVVEQQTHHTVDQYFDSVNTLMITGAMDDREVLRNKILERKEIIDARIIRGSEVSKVFGPGFDHELAKDELDKKALQGNDFSFIKENEKGIRVLTVIKPFRALKNYRGTNCLECHEVKEGTVLGAVRISYNLNDLDAQIDSNTMDTAKLMAFLFFMALILIAFILRLLIIKRITLFKTSLDQMSKNFDLTTRISDTKSKDEIAKMAISFNQMIESFHSGMRQVENATRELISGSQEIARLTENTKEAIFSQQDETNKVASAMTEMSTTAKQVASNAHEAKIATETANDQATQGSKQAESVQSKISTLTSYVEDTTKRMENLEMQSSKITEVIDMINEITTKTQHLSINAAVEAARAGVHGRGFVVVAEEIGELAQQTKQSTNQIQEITQALKDTILSTAEIMRETKNVAQEGNEQVVLSTNALMTIAKEVSNVNEFNSHISIAASEQSSASDDIDSNLQIIMDLNNQTSQSAVKMEEVGEQFSTMAENLKLLISKFKL